MSVASAPGSGGFLQNINGPPKVFMTDITPHPPEKALISWKEEGYDVTYVQYIPSAQSAYIRTIQSLGNGLKLGEHYALVAFGAAASVVLKTAMKPLIKCCAIIAYYPPVLPDAKVKYPDSTKPQIHVASKSQRSPHPDMVDWKLYRYEYCATGFADPNSNAYSEGETNLAFSRALACVRRGFKQEVDLEPVVQSFWAAKYEDDVPERASMSVVKNMTQNSPHVTILPTLQGGVGRKKLEEFYREFFVPSLVEDFKIRLVSRTLGIERIVDEMVVSFTHSDEIDWILPGVQPTDKFVEIPMVSVVAVRGGKLVSEHMYWDQASVLVQVGLLDPKLVPKKFKDQGTKQLPVAGAEAAKQLVSPQQGQYNKLLQMHGLFDGINGY
ncbi:hypothetical protein OPT61_g8757 [Boeremia exigua]|uniref:Uncharacterized protein n=1 Tax=Boeremia exigua TaxID=749465 RepID=A0ACC2HWX8_9PLEO|nr:hypothetical protein OPT61_g8757 [Boeremia exigua]